MTIESQILAKITRGVQQEDTGRVTSIKHHTVDTAWHVTLCHDSGQGEWEGGRNCLQCQIQVSDLSYQIKILSVDSSICNSEQMNWHIHFTFVFACVSVSWEGMRNPFPYNIKDRNSFFLPLILLDCGHHPMSADTAPAESAAVRGWETQLYNAGMWQPCHYSSFPDYQLTDWCY